MNWRPSRRDMLRVAPASLAALTGGFAANAAPGPSLGAIANASGVLFGAAIAPVVLSDPAYAALYASEARVVTTDYSLKFDALRPAPDRYDFGGADSLLAFAQKNRLPMRGHTLVWNENAPDWLRRLSGRETERVFDEHIETVVSRYAGKLHSWDVVNEPFWPDHGKEGGYRDGPWLAAMGPAYVERAFRRVAAIDPAAKLVLNEAHCENDNSYGKAIRPRLLNLVDKLLNAGLRLDAVGLQCHLQPDIARDNSFVRSYIEQIGGGLVDIYITELDVNDEPFQGSLADRDAASAREYEAFLTEILKARRVTAVILWELSDKYTWYLSLPKVRENLARRSPRPLPFDDRMQPKLSRAAIARAFAMRLP